MGSICSIISNPRNWRVYKTDMCLVPEYGGESILKVVYGACEDDPDGICELEAYMRTSVYEKLVAGKYKVSPDSKWRRKLIITDAHNNTVPSIKGLCY